MTATEQDREEFEAFCRNATPYQLGNIVAKERLAGRLDFARIAEKEMQQRADP